jgi:serine/threonine protein kinase
MREKFVFSYVIGKGGFGKVYSAFHIDSKEWFAIKETNISGILQHKNGFSLLMSEVQALKRVGRHPCIVSLNSAFHDSRFCYMALDLCTGGDLRYHMKNREKFTERQIAFIVACIGSALHHCHSKGVLHRDVKPENILIDETGYAMLTDFGVAHSSETFMLHPSKDVTCTMASGTRQYLAPEVFTPSHTHGCPSDFWSLGVVTYELLYGKRPFDSHCPMTFIQYAAKHLPDTRHHDHHQKDFDHEPDAVKKLSCIACIPRGDRALFVDQGCHYQCVARGIRRSDLLVVCPEMSHVAGYISSSCRRVLHGLFSVNQARRWGHGDRNYQLLRNDNWFAECRVNWDEIEEARAEPQFLPNLREVSMDICHMYIQDDKDRQMLSACSTCAVAMAEIGCKQEHRGGCCMHRERVLATPGIREALGGVFYLAPEYAEYDPALDSQWKAKTAKGHLRMPPSLRDIEHAVCKEHDKTIGAVVVDADGHRRTASYCGTGSDDSSSSPSSPTRPLDSTKLLRYAENEKDIPRLCHKDCATMKALFYRGNSSVEIPCQA